MQYANKLCIGLYVLLSAVLHRNFQQVITIIRHYCFTLKIKAIGDMCCLTHLKKFTLKLEVYNRHEMLLVAKWTDQALLILLYHIRIK